MGGGLMQLVAYGAQDIYLTGSPMITYFKAIYRRHTNFSIETIQQTFDGNVDFGRRTSALLSRNGDLVTGAYIQALLPDLHEKNVVNESTLTLSGLNTSVGAAHRRYTRWIDNIGHYLIKQVDVEIGGQLIDRHYSDWLEIWAQLTVPAEQMSGYRKMIGQDPKNALGQNTGLQADVFNRTTPLAGNSSFPSQPATNNFIKGRYIFVPLQFWFCRNEGLALPLISLQYHEVRIAIEFRALYDLVIVGASDNANNNVIGPESQYRSSVRAGPLQASLWVDYVYLDTDERQRFAQVSHEYLIEQLQFTGDETINIPGSADLVQYAAFNVNFSHPVKEIVWILKFFEEDHEWSNFTDTGLSGRYPVQTQQYSTSTGASAGLTGLPESSSYQSVSDTTVTTGSLSALTAFASLVQFAQYDSVRPWGNVGYSLAQNPVHDAKLTLNGQDRIPTMPGFYFSRKMPLDRHTNAPVSPGINVYSFALHPEAFDPSGSCNFSRLDRVKLHMNVKTTWRDGSCGIKTQGTLRVYGVSYNILRIMSGMGGVAYTS